jgi:sulfite reductase alpha subunit-like flavoprotein/predicted heme/steroid binding protein
MFYYFGYGSNMNPLSLRAKGVNPLSAEPAILTGWQLKFNVPDFFLIEGGTGNIVPSPGDEVHGMLYSCGEESAEILDRLEAVGVNYGRIKIAVTSYSGQAVSAHAYVGLPDKVAPGYQPSRRYLNILVRGAEISGISPAYVTRLKALEVKSEPVFRPFRLGDAMRAKVYTSKALTPNLTAIAGAVFDLSEARPDHSYLQAFLAGKDMTLFFLQRMDTSDGREEWNDLLEGRLSVAQKRYLTQYLHEFDREYRLVGSMDYTLDLTITKARTGLGSQTPSPRASAYTVLQTAEATHRYLGHENLGFLSFSHGFIPKIPPKQMMPPAYRAWDEIAADLPRLYRTLELRRTLDLMPELDATEEALADSYLLRAATLLAMLSHAYNYVEVSPPTRLPTALSKPWAEVRRRLGREQEVLSYIDLIVYNWRMIDPTAPDGLRAENLDLLVPTVGNREERFFYLTQTEILAQAAPIIGAIARSQEAVKNHDKATVETELLIILKALEAIVYDSLPKINPNDASHSYVDAVIWAKTVAPFAVPLKQNVQGPSGTSSPIFNLLDEFFGRTSHQSFLGKEIKSLRSGYPHFWQEFIDAVGQVSVARFVEESRDASLQAVFRDTFAMYAGPNGFLGRHRTKVYGYLETAFKVGRSVTIGGFSGLFKERTWEQVDLELEYSRLERTERFPDRCYYGRIKAVGQTHLSASESVKHIVIDIADSGIIYRPGDRCGILPENSEHLIGQTLAVLDATGDEPIPLTEEWLKAVQLRYGHESTTVLNLRTFLRFAKLRPVGPRVAEALHAFSQNPRLAEAIKKQTTTRWQLSDLLWLLKADGADPRVLWQSQFQDPFHIARVLPPEQFRMYSISSGLENGETPSEIHLTVGRLRYHEDEVEQDMFRERLGTASNFLATGHGRSIPVSIIIDHPPRFSLPLDPSIPIVMIGGGTGFAPFRSFIASRMQQRDAGPSWLLLSLRDRDHFYYQEDLIPGLGSGSLELDVVFSREDSRPVFTRTTSNYGRFDYVPSLRSHIQDLLLQGDRGEKLWKLLQKKEDGGEGAYLYICGRTRFAKSIHDALKKTFSRFFTGSSLAREKAAHRALAKIAAEGRFMQEIFTHARSWNADRPEIDVSEVVLYNSEERGYWMIIDGGVYDFSDFMELHPGGRTVLRHYCGIDATQGFAKVHNGHSEIEAMRDMYEIGVVRHLDFKGVSRIVEFPGAQPSPVAVSALYRKWVGILFLVVEMENALRLDQSLQDSVTTRGEVSSDRTYYKLQRSIETHQRFVTSYASELSGRPFIELWDLTRGMSTGKSHWMKDVMGAIHVMPNAQFPTALTIRMAILLDDLAKGRQAEIEREVFIHACEKMESADLLLLSQIKESLRKGVKIFEENEEKVLEKGAWRMITELQKIPSAFEAYYHEMQLIFTMVGGKLGDPPSDVSQVAKAEVVVHYADTYWSFEEHPDKRIFYLRRTPVAATSLEDLVTSNERVIDFLRRHDDNKGLVVDMREAPQRNDAEFESGMAHLRMTVSMTFARVAVLLETATGLLQVNRIGRNDGSEIFATTNEYAAVKFASTVLEAPHPP